MQDTICGKLCKKGKSLKQAKGLVKYSCSYFTFSTCSNFLLVPVSLDIYLRRQNKYEVRLHMRDIQNRARRDGVPGVSGRGRGAGQRAPPPCPSSYCGSPGRWATNGELACPCAHKFSEGSPEPSPRVDTRVQLCLGAFSPQVREDAGEARTHVYGRPACVRAFGPCVPEDASQVRHDTCAYRPCPHVSAGAWV